MYIEQLAELESKLANSEFPEDVDFLKDMNKSYANYTNAIRQMEQSIQINSLRMDTKTYQETIMNFDKNRKTHHDACISNLKITNRMAEANGMKEIFPGVENEDRTTIAEKYIIPIATEYECAARGEKTQRDNNFIHKLNNIAEKQQNGMEYE